MCDVSPPAVLSAVIRALFSCLLSRMVEHLLRNGAEPSLLDRHGYTVAHYAAFSGNRHALEMVLVQLLMFFPVEVTSLSL